MTRFPRRAPAFAAVAAVAVLAAAGCSAGRPVSTAPLAGAADPVAVAPQRADPSTWTLPMQAYRPTAEQDRTITDAETTLVERCLAGFGVAWRPPAELPPIGPRNLLDWRYGIHDRAAAAAYGYQVDPRQQARYDAALRAEEQRPGLAPDAQIALAGTDAPPELLAQAGPEARRGRVAGRKVPAGGCLGEARRTLGSDTRGVSPLVQRLTNSSYPQSMAAPAVKAVFARWSACMRAKGFTYPAPMAANDDPQFRPRPQGPSAKEIATAVADIDCRVAHRVAETWHTAEAAAQRRSIADHAGELAADRRALDAVVHKARAVLARP
ncbi:hypothetical protein [Streptomyces sp. NPDC089919]|uniref:hypothetical protein n=1 Tax=Streptomyces sp. NPDC089919 TaxID=3155188 RepID=UPI0034340701